MTTVVFVHGGGVREAGFALTFKFLQQMFLDQGIIHTLAPCFWGGDRGSKFPVLCIPKAEHGGSNTKRLTGEETVAQWETLYRDPFSELRSLKTRSNMQGRPSQRLGMDLWMSIDSYLPSPRVKDFLAKWQITSYWDRAWRSIVANNQVSKDVLLVSGQDVREPAESIGRGLVAQMTILALADHMPALDGDHRDELVNLLITDWLGRDGGAHLHLTRLLADIHTPPEPNRGRPTDATSTALGDVLLYQARGDDIRSSIQHAIITAIDSSRDADTHRVVLLAHSLGGIACVDLLAKNALPHVTHLITVGSQSPYLYEIGALHGLDRSKNEKLPSTFPPWLNLYDPNDFLSYVAEPVFQTKAIRDVRIDSGQPFPESHGAYWTNTATWRAIKEFVI